MDNGNKSLRFICSNSSDSDEEPEKRMGINL